MKAIHSHLKILFRVVLILSIPHFGLAQENSIWNEVKSKTLDGKVLISPHTTLLKNLSIGNVITVPFENRTISLSLSRKLAVEGQISFLFKDQDNPFNSLVISTDFERVTAFLRTKNESRYLKFHPRENLYSLESISDSEILECGGVSVIDKESHSHRLKKKAKENDYETHGFPSGAESDTVTIDLMFLYTTDAKDWSENSSEVTNIFASMNTALMLGQEALENSNIALKFRVVHTQEVQNSSFTTTNQILEALQANEYPNADLQALREQYGADLICLFDEISDVGGLAYGFYSLGGDPTSAFNVNRIQQAHISTSLIHEIAHNLGNMHGRNQQDFAADATGGIFSYSTGYAFSGENDQAYATVMNYSILSDGSSASKIPYFSNPNVLYDGKATGSYETPNGPSDAAKTINITKYWIAGYQNTVVNPPDITVSESEMIVSVLPAQTLTQSLTISNTGTSDLIWNAKVFISGEPHRSETNQHLVFSDNFEVAEGYSPNTNAVQGLWKTIEEAYSLEIITQNALSNQQSLRIPFRNEQYVYSPYINSKSRGEYNFQTKVKFDGSLGDVFISLFDGPTNLGSFNINENGEVFVFRRNIGNEAYQLWPSVSVGADSIISLSISLSPENNSPLTYSVGDSTFTFTNQSYSIPNHILVSTFSENPTNGLILDDVELKVQSHGIGISNIEPKVGILSPNENATVEIEFSGANLDAGVYQGNLFVRSNDANSPSVSIPITLDVTTSSSADSLIFSKTISGNIGWRMLSSPKSNFSPSDIMDDTAVQLSDFEPSLFSYNSENNWTSFDSSSHLLPDGYGYILYFWNQDTDVSKSKLPRDLTLVGNEPQSDITLSINPDTTQNGDGGFTLLGNPFATNYDLSQLYVQSGSLQDVIQIWKHDANNESGGHWQPLSRSSGGNNGAELIVEPWQGFFVQTTNDFATNLTIPIAGKSTTRSADILHKKSEAYPEIIFTAIQNESVLSKAVIRFHPEANFDWDIFDAHSLTPLSSNYVSLSLVSWPNGKEEHKSVASFPISLDEPLEINLAVAANYRSESISIFWAGIESLPDNWSVEMISSKEKMYDLRINQSIKTLPTLRVSKNDAKSLKLMGTTEEPTSETWKLKIIPQKDDENQTPTLPTEIAVSQNYPNPFNPTTSVVVSLPQTEHVSIMLYDISGRLLNKIMDKTYVAGNHNFPISMIGEASGLYLLRVQIGENTFVRKITLLK